MIKWITTEQEHDRLTWTQFWDMHSGGYTKTDYDMIYIQAPEDEATKIFIEMFGQHPDTVGCRCCGENFSVSEYDDGLARASAFQRRVTVHDDGTETQDGMWSGPGSKSMKLTEYCEQDSVLVVYTRERGEEI